MPTACSWMECRQVQHTSVRHISVGDVGCEWWIHASRVDRVRVRSVMCTLDSRGNTTSVQTTNPQTAYSISQWAFIAVIAHQLLSVPVALLCVVRASGEVGSRGDTVRFQVGTSQSTDMSSALSPL